MRRADIEHVAPLTPLQAGMLFHALSEPEAHLHIEQGVSALDGPLDLDAFRDAWQIAMDRHAALRTACFWRELSQPLQIAYRSVAVPLAVHDALEAEAAGMVERLLVQHRTELTAVDRAPLMRLALLRHGADRWRVIWSIHHLVHDAWSLDVILRDVWTVYEGRRSGVTPSLAEARPFSDFVRWQKEHASPDAARFWRAALAEVNGRRQWDGTNDRSVTGPRLGAPSAETMPSRYGHVDVWLDPDETRAIEATLRQAALTLSSAAFATWGLVVADRGGTDDVLFGVVMLGRPTELDGVDRMVGPFINTLPLHVRVARGGRAGDWLRAVQSAQHGLRPFEQCALADIRAWCGWPTDRPLVSTIVVVQQVFRSVAGPQIAGLRVGALETRGQPSYPLMFRVTPGHQLRLEIVYDRGRVADHLARDLVTEVEHRLRHLTADLEAPVVRRAPSSPASRHGAHALGTSSARLAAIRPKPRRIEPLAQGGARPHE